MWPYYPELLAIPVPRYTSFPTAAEFSEDVSQADFLHALEDVSGEISLYIHIPFCEKICWYCGCNTSAANRTDRVTSYLDTLHQEISLVASRVSKSAKVTRISLGGGSPNAIAPIELVRLFVALTVEFSLSDDVVLSMELDPRTMTAQWAEVIAAVGIGRASLGVQTFAPHLQEAIGRVQPMRHIAQTVDWLREAGVTSLNFDLMYGLPGQTWDDLESTLAQAAEMGADRIALFGYAHVPHLISRQRKIDGTALPDQAARFTMAAKGHAYLCDNGYAPVGFDHFARGHDPMALAAKLGILGRNFQGFTDDSSPVLIGLGASAISSFPGLHMQNEKNAGRYRMLLSQGKCSASRGVVRTPEDRERGDIVMRLLCDGKAEIGAGQLAAAMPQLAPFMERGLVSCDDGTLAIAADGLPYARSIAAVFDPYRQDSVRRFSSAI